jgi:hypothetical protein
LSFASSKPLNAVCKDFYDRFDIDFIGHDSSYIGEYLKYSGVYADVIRILPNVMPNSEYVYGENKDIETIVEIFFTNGKNAEKLSKYKYMKGSVGRMNGMLIIKDEIVEEP